MSDKTKQFCERPPAKMSIKDLRDIPNKNFRNI